MYKLASVALSAVLGVAGIAGTAPAEARPIVSVGIGLPGIAVVEPFGYYRPYPIYYAHGPYWRPGYVRYGYGYGYGYRYGYGYAHGRYYGHPYRR
jgi:hypothetical protein